MSRRSRARRPCFAGRPYVDSGAAGPFPEPDRPVFAFDRRLAMLERSFYRHLLRAIDLDALFGLEQMLWFELQELAVFADEHVLDISNAIITRSLDRVAHDPRRSMKQATLGHDGHLVEVPEEPHEHCPFCGPAASGGAEVRSQEMAS